MHGTTRELNLATISFVATVFVLLLIVIVAGSTAWFRYEFEQQRQRRIAQYGTSRALVETLDAQRENLRGEQSGVAIDDAVATVAERY